MSDERDPLLLELFADSQSVTPDDEFTKQVMNKTFALRKKLIVIATFVSVLLVLYTAVFGAPLQDFALLMAQFLSTNLIDIGENWLALIVSPLNSVAGLLALLFKSFLTVQKRLRLISV